MRAARRAAPPHLPPDSRVFATEFAAMASLVAVPLPAFAGVGVSAADAAAAAAIPPTGTGVAFTTPVVLSGPLCPTVCGREER